MHRLLPALAIALGGAASCAADDLAVLKPGPKDESPGKMLYRALLGECQDHFRVRKAAVDKLATPADIAGRQAALKKKFIDALGGFPEKTPLNARTVGTLKRDGYRVEKVVYESRPEHHVTASLYLPDGPGPFPGIIMPIGHSQTGKSAEYMQRGAILLVKNGFAALVYDPIGQGERIQLLDKLGKPAIKASTSEHTMCGVGALLVGRSTASYRIWDGIRSIDYLVSRPEVDAQKIGCTGCSGGGTLTSYLMALDDRIAAAAPSCYITSLDRLFSTIGPQDAEQNITGQVAFGLDHADYILLRAPKPTILLASTRDFFDIQGTWDSFREAKRIYTKLGFPEQLDLMEADADHGYPKSHREAMARFFARWLKGENRAIVEGEFPIEKEADLWCTRSGQVLEDLKGRSVFDLNAARAAELAKQRAAKKRTPAELRTEVARLIGAHEPAAADTRQIGRIDRKDCQIHKSVYQMRDGMPVPVLLFVPGNRDSKGLPIMHLSDRGAAAPASLEQIELLVKAGRRVAAADLRGFGETAPGTGKPGPFGFDQKEAFLALHLNRPLLGQRVNDIRSIVREQRGADGIAVMAHGAAALPALHAAAIDDSIKSLTLDGGLATWESVVRTPISQNQLTGAVPGALAVYDLPDLAAAIAPRRLIIRNPVDAAGNPLSKEAAEETYRAVRAAYTAAKAGDRFLLEVELK